MTEDENAHEVQHTPQVLTGDDESPRQPGPALDPYTPEPGARPDTTSAATPGFWVGCGFQVAVDDDRFPVMRREL